MAPTTKPPTAVQETPEQIALAEATAEVARLHGARREAMATLERIQTLTTQQGQVEYTAQALVEEIRQIPGTSVGRLVTVEGRPPTPLPTATRADIARARLARVGAEDRVICAEADYLDAERALSVARHALAVRQMRDALPSLTAAKDALLTDAMALATKADAVFAEHIRPLLEGNPLGGAVQEARLPELDMLRDRAPRLKAVLAALTDQYLPSPNGDH